MSAPTFTKAMQRRAAAALHGRRCALDAEWPPVTVLVERGQDLHDLAGLPNLREARSWAEGWRDTTGEAPLYLARTGNPTSPLVEVVL